MKRTLPLFIFSICSAYMFTGACKEKNKLPQCAEVSSHFVDLLRSELIKETDPQKVATAKANLPTLQNELTKACEEQQWGLSTRNCLLDANNSLDGSSCKSTFSDKKTL